MGAGRFFFFSPKRLEPKGELCELAYAMRNDAKNQSTRPPRRRRRKGKPTSDKAKSQTEVLQRVSEIDREQAADVALTPVEAAEFKEHFEFLARHRKLLKLKANAQEELLLGGSREPTHRGVCLHLLKKVDRQMVTSALSRMGDPKLKTQFLAGLMKFYPDVPILLAYLEAVKDSSSRSAAAATLSVGLTRLDFSQVSPAQMRRVLDLIAQIFEPAVLPQVMLGLLGSSTFRGALDDSLDVLPAKLREIFEPLRVLYPVIWKGHRRGLDLEAVETGLKLMMQMPDANLRKYPERIRERIVQACLLLPRTEGRIDRGINILLEAFPKKSRTYSELAMKRAAAFLSSSEEAKAKKILSQLTTSHPDFQTPKRWLEAMAKPRLGSCALVEWPAETPWSAMKPGLWHMGFSFEHQQSVWVDAALETDVEAFNFATKLHRNLGMPQVLPILETANLGQEVESRILPALGKPAVDVYVRGKIRGPDALRLARDGVAFIAGAFNLDVTLSRLMLRDCHVDAQGRLWLARVSHGQEGQDSTSALGAAEDWIHTVLKMTRDKAYAQKLRGLMGAGGDLAELYLKLTML